ncbi:VOC family protein [Streptomyces pactum]|uniref:VOC family protein n=1 Tax=Streptomyces pactum TaxID=68249 RepID=UPI0035580D2A
MRTSSCWGGREPLGSASSARRATSPRPACPDPAHSKQAHLELGVDDLDAAQERMLALGAILPSFQPRPEVWRVLLDPAGHPFCLSTHAN